MSKLKIQPIVPPEPTLSRPGQNHTGVAASSHLVIATRTNAAKLNPTFLLHHPLAEGETNDGFVARNATEIVALVRRPSSGIIIRDHRHRPPLSTCSTCGGSQERRYKLYGPMDIPLWGLLVLASLETPAFKYVDLPRLSIDLGCLNRIPFVKRWITTPSYQSVEAWFENVVEVRCPRCSDLSLDGQRLWSHVGERHSLRKLPGFREGEFAWQAKYRPGKFQLLPKEESRVWQSWQDHLRRLATPPLTVSTA